MGSHITEVVNDILEHSPDPESEAADLLNHLQTRFGWAGFVLARQDVSDDLGRSLTDEEWAKVTSAQAWRAMTPIFREGAWDYVTQALAEAGIR